MQNKINQKLSIADWDKLLEALKNGGGKKLYQHYLDVGVNITSSNRIQFYMYIITDDNTPITSYDKMVEIFSKGNYLRYAVTGGSVYPRTKYILLENIDFDTGNLNGYNITDNSEYTFDLYNQTFTIEDSVIPCELSN